MQTIKCTLLAAMAASLSLSTGCQTIPTWRELWHHEFPPYTNGVVVLPAEPVPKHRPDSISSGESTLTPKRRKTVSNVEPTPPEARRVEGAKNLVWSPFKNGVQIDIAGMPPGSEAKDPFTGKIFLVPID